MNRIAIVLCLLVAAVSANAQMNQFTGLNQNYVVTNTIQVSGVTSQSGINALKVQDNSQTIQYFDGLGRPVQTVITQGSPLQKDVVQQIVYDQFGREAVKYLPYVHNQTSGWFVPNVLGSSGYIGSLHYNFYNNGSTDKVEDDTNPFAVTKFEPSPLNRPIESGAPGSAWQPDGTNSYSSTDRTVKHAYEFNTTEQVLRWTYTYPTDGYQAGLVSTPGQYAAKELYRNKTKDEQHHQVIEYIDKSGRVVLKRVQAVANDGSGNPPAIDDTNYASTYYIYDDFGNLVCVIQPEGVRLISQYTGASDTNAKHTFLAKWAFRYSYDGRRRMTLKQVPGADPVYMIYDNRDRLVMTQDGNQRTITTERPVKEWIFTKYDALNRPVITGIYANDSSPATIQGTLSAVTSVPSESYSGTGSYNGYDNASFPTDALASKYLTVTYYDVYDATIVPSGYAPVNQGLKGEETGTQAFKIGQVTGGLVRKLGSNTWLRTVNYYDGKYRLIQSVSDHHKGTVRTSNVYDFAGKVLFTQRKYIVNGTETRIKESFIYDHAGRLLVTKHSINGSKDVAIAGNYYNELGQLVAKGLHHENYPTIDEGIGQPNTTHAYNIVRDTYSASESTLIAQNSITLEDGFIVGSNQTFHGRIGSTRQEAAAATLPGFQQVVDYRYNICGWLKSINDPNSPGVDYFSMSLGYNSPTSNGGAAQFNGNISEAIWQTVGMPKQSYGYSYDAINRLTKGQYYDLVTSAKNGTYNEEIGAGTSRPAYDLNGNILNIKRYGRISDESYDLMDDLQYDYNNNGNQLHGVADAVATTTTEAGFKEIETSSDYLYDANGSMKKDENKGIIEITYNHLNLPHIVRKSVSDYIVYTYDATGRKLTQQVFGSEAKTTDYIGELIYENNALQFVNHSEGRVIPNGSWWEYEYHLKDHLGNVRFTFTTQNETESATGTLESANLATEQSQFLRYQNAKRVRSSLFDRTSNSSTGYSERLNGGTNEKYGLAKSISVMPGDVINMEVYAKYVDPNQNNRAQALNDLLAAIASNTGGIVIDGTNFTSSTASFPYPGYVNTSASSGTGPKAFLNWIVFDRDFQMKDAGFVRMTTAGKETGQTLLEGEAGVDTGQGVEHEKLSAQVQISQPGYVYVFLSNEETTPVEVYFDEFKVEQVKSAIVQVNDYYPFGLTFNSHSREAATEQPYLYNGMETQNELDLRWMDYGARMYLSDLGRWASIDAKAEVYQNIAPYAYAANQPTNAIDPDGKLVIFINGFTLNSVEQGTQWYWREYQVQQIQRSHSWSALGGFSDYDYRPVQTGRAFDKRVSDQLGDGNRRYVHGGNVLSSTTRRKDGAAKGYEDAPDIINSLHKTNGVIDETIKIITHSMGSVYGDGYIYGIKKYLREHPELKRQVKITLVVDFDAYNGAQIRNSGDIKKQHFVHRGDEHITGIVANERENGAHQEEDSDESDSHLLFSFFGNINQIQEGTYKWNEQTQEWELQKKKKKQ